MKKRKESESGAIIMEATLTFTAFIFLMFIILSITDICYIQARMQIAVNYAAEDISEYTYLYYKFGVDDLSQSVADGAKPTEDSIKTVEQKFSNFSSQIGNVSESINGGDFDDIYSSVIAAGNSGNVLTSEVKNKAEYIAEHPSQFAFGLMFMALDKGVDLAKSGIAQALGYAFVRKNLKEGDLKSKEFLQKYRVTDMNFMGSQMMMDDSQKEIILTCEYKVQLWNLLNTNYEIKFRATAHTNAWGYSTRNSKLKDK